VAIVNESVLRRLAKPLLVAAPVIWGASFVIMKSSLDSFTPFCLLAIRFSIAAAVLGLLCRKSWKKLDRDYWKAGAIIGTVLFLAYAVQTFGLERTTPGKNAFLTAVYCVIVPFLHWAVSRRRPDRWNVLAAVLCVVGIGMVSLSTPSESGALAMNLGDALTLLGGFFFAAHIVAVDRYAQDRDIFLITALQFAFFAAWSWVGVLLFREPMPSGLTAEDIGGMAFLILFASLGGQLFQNIGQKYVPAATAAVILSLEAPFGVLASVMVGAEQVNGVMLAGFALIFVAVVCSETKLSFLRRQGAGA